jgi:methionine synthase II (cobalamin-independent)
MPELSVPEIEQFGKETAEPEEVIKAKEEIQGAIEDVKEIKKIKRHVCKTVGEHFYNKQEILKVAFRDLADRLRPMGYLAEFRWIVGRYYVTLSQRRSDKKTVTKEGSR